MHAGLNSALRPAPKHQKCGNSSSSPSHDNRDYQDAVRLSIECGVSTIDELRDLLQQFFPGDPIPSAAELRFAELVEDINTRLR
jgi:hypothetical protein